MKKILFLSFSSLAILLIVVATFSAFRYQKTEQYYIDTFNTYLKQASQDKSSDMVYKVDKALDVITQGIKKYPNRLDMRIGKAYVCKMIGHIPCIERELSDMVEQSTLNNNQWDWLNNETKDKAFLLQEIQVYQFYLWQNQKDNEVIRIAEAILKYYPNHFESLNSLAIAFMARGQLDKAQSYLLKAQALAPNDEIVKNNLKELEQMKKISH